MSVEISDFSGKYLDYPKFQLKNGAYLVSDGTKRTKEEAQFYYDAFLCVVPIRICTLLQWHDEFLTYDPVADLLRFGEKVVQAISKPEYLFTITHEETVFGSKSFKMEVRWLEDHSAAMCIDMGLLLAMYLLQINKPEIKWHMRKRGPRMHDYHKVTISSHLDYLSFDPTYQSIGWGVSAVEGKRTHKIWSEYYLMWRDYIEGREPRDLSNV
jgi:hypothetical protein